MAVVPFTRIVVDKKEEAKFRRRAMRSYPLEHIEALWGQVRGDILYICAFIRMDIERATVKTLYYDEQEMDFHEEDAREAGLHFLGTIHTHPNCDDTRFGDTDLENAQETQETVMGICAVTKNKRTGRKATDIAYWPVVRPLITIRRDHSAPKRRGKKPMKSNKKKR
jgi:proteasome lid subunit RPN8/RPN11